MGRLTNKSELTESTPTHKHEYMIQQNAVQHHLFSWTSSTSAWPTEYSNSLNLNFLTQALSLAFKPSVYTKKSVGASCVQEIFYADFLHQE